MLFGLGDRALFWSQIKPKRSTGWHPLVINYFIGISVMVGKSILDLLYSSGIKGARGLAMALLAYSSKTVLT